MLTCSESRCHWMFVHYWQLVSQPTQWSCADKYVQLWWRRMTQTQAFSGGSERPRLQEMFWTLDQKGSSLHSSVCAAPWKYLFESFPLSILESCPPVILLFTARAEQVGPQSLEFIMSRLVSNSISCIRGRACDTNEVIKWCGFFFFLLLQFTL